MSSASGKKDEDNTFSNMEVTNDPGKHFLTKPYCGGFKSEGKNDGNGRAQFLDLSEFPLKKSN